jgi:hypothetical protein
VQMTSMKKLSVIGAFRFSEFRVRDCVPVLMFSVSYYEVVFYSIFFLCVCRISRSLWQKLNVMQYGGCTKLSLECIDPVQLNLSMLSIR